LIRRLRADSHTRPTAIAVLSRSPSLADEASYRRAGANVVFAGTVHPELWDARLEELLNVPRRLEARIPVRLATWSRATPEAAPLEGDRKSTRLNSSHQIISYAAFCLEKKTRTATPSSTATSATHATEPPSRSAA